MMQQVDYEKFAVDLRHVATPKIGLTRLDVAKIGAIAEPGKDIREQRETVFQKLQKG